MELTRQDTLRFHPTFFLLVKKAALLVNKMAQTQLNSSFISTTRKKNT
jgi:hypothetical protein